MRVADALDAERDGDYVRAEDLWRALAAECCEAAGRWTEMINMLGARAIRAEKLRAADLYMWRAEQCETLRQNAYVFRFGPTPFATTTVAVLRGAR